MESLQNVQEATKAAIVRAISNFKKTPKDRLNIAYVETRLESLEQQWQVFFKTHLEIMGKVNQATLQETTYFKDDVYEEVEELYIEYKAHLKDKLSKLKKHSDPLPTSEHRTDFSSQHTNIKLPEIKIPMFSGKYDEWQTFRDLFLGLVHKNNSLDAAQKLYYLKGHLVGDAAQLLKNISVTSDNYISSWEKLESMYNNKRFLANNILKRLFGQKGLNSESAQDIKNLINTTSDCLESMKNLGIDVSTWDILIIYMISGKLDKETRKAWELSVSSDATDEFPTYEKFTQFLTGRFRCLENLDTKNSFDRVTKTSQSYHAHDDKRETLNITCTYCKANHKISNCTKFAKESNDARRCFAQENGLCFICLYNNHSAKACKTNFKCHLCKKRHHTLLHPSSVSQPMGENSMRSDESDVETEGATASSTRVEKSSEQTVVSCVSTGNCKETVLLTTALVKAKSKNGTYLNMRALLDQGSQGSFITESMVQYLGLKKTLNKHTVTGVGGNNNLLSKATVTLHLKSRINPSVCIKVSAYVLKSITSLLPSVEATPVEWVSLTADDLADPEYYKPNKIDVLLGAEIYSQVIRAGIKRSTGGRVLAQDTTLGWIISGVVETETSSGAETLSCITVMHVSIQADDFLKKFWELEGEPAVTKKILSEEEVKCEQLFEATTRRDENGRYIVRLPFKDDNQNCADGGSKLIAEKRFKSLESKLSKNIKLKTDYSQVIHEYAEMNHMIKVPKQEINKKGLYLPHHAVIREDKETTKVRVVFDASCKGSNGVSLNDNLMIGPTLQADLRHIVMRWRRHLICLVADIVKMYRQVLVDRKDTPFQRILWRDSPEMDIEEHELVTVTFGTASAPFLAVRALQQIAYDEAHESPRMKEIILNDFYMDDLMTGAENIEEGYSIYNEIKAILAKGGFPLQKWISNSVELLHKIKEETRDKDDEVKIKLDANITKILGLTWDPRADSFQYSVDLASPVQPVTKRRVLSEISKLFDPLGWLAPSIILAKTMIQKLWLAGIDWDEEVPSNLQKEWLTYRNSLTSLENVKVPRWLNTKSDDKTVQLHGFSDASKMAYAAVIYIRVEDSEGNVHVSLVTSKTKVAPIKQVSIPRLELCGATLLTKLIIEVANVLNVNKENLFAWTDSEVVLAWLNGHPSRWKTFVANRVSEILTSLDTHHWSYVQSKQNPADCASRGVAPAELAATTIWFEGPNFLKNKLIECKKPKHVHTNLEEVKTLTCVMDDVFIWNKYSSLDKLIRIIAYCRRFLNLKSSSSKKNYTTYLNVEEMNEALNICIKKSQGEDFSEELRNLKEKGRLDLKNRTLKSLNLFLDKNGIIRVGGRLEMSQLEYDRKHPILLSRKSFITNLLIADSHVKTMHGGPQAMLTYLRTKYWIIGVKLSIKAYFRKCVTCTRYSNRTQTQLMGQLPSPRVTPNKPFLCSGVDYAGPINIRTSKGRGQRSYKGYIALFICLSTRAVHLEAVSDMTSKGFLAAYKRFVARRGRCAELHSDNGTNFVGAARELTELFDKEKSTFIPELAEYLANNGTQWKFIPPHAPNFGGIWEAGIKSTKYHLRRVIGNSTLTFEEIATVLAQIEACLNSRPLSYVEDHAGLEVLSPGHFLVGEPLVLVPDTNYEKCNISCLRRWQLTQRMLQDFWRHWSQDYLHQFLQRHKWVYQNPEPKVGDVVLIKEDDMPPGRWLLGRVDQKHPGPDQVTRVITIRTQNSLIKRPVSKVCVLPIAV